MRLREVQVLLKRLLPLQLHVTRPPNNRHAFFIDKRADLYSSLLALSTFPPFTAQALFLASHEVLVEGFIGPNDSVFVQSVKALKAFNQELAAVLSVLDHQLGQPPEFFFTITMRGAAIDFNSLQKTIGQTQDLLGTILDLADLDPLDESRFDIGSSAIEFKVTLESLTVIGALLGTLVACVSTSLEFAKFEHATVVDARGQSMAEARLKMEREKHKVDLMRARLELVFQVQSLSKAPKDDLPAVEKIVDDMISRFQELTLADVLVEMQPTEDEALLALFPPELHASSQSLYGVNLAPLQHPEFRQLAESHARESEKDEDEDEDESVRLPRVRWFHTTEDTPDSDEVVEVDEGDVGGPDTSE